MTRVTLVLLLATASVAVDAGAPPQLNLGTARVFAPASVLFNVPDVNVQTNAAGTVTVSFDTAILLLGQALRISVRADDDLTIAGGPAIPAANVFWTTSNAVNGIGFNGTLSRTVYTPVYESNIGAFTGRVDLAWKLSPPGAGVRRSGTRTAQLRWRFEAVTP
jgi:hypothetical protein